MADDNHAEKDWRQASQDEKFSEAQRLIDEENVSQRAACAAVDLLPATFRKYVYSALLVLRKVALQRRRRVDDQLEAPVYFLRRS